MSPDPVREDSFPSHADRHGGESVLDAEVMSGLIELGADDPSFLMDLIDLFLGDAGLRIETMASACEQGDLSTVEAVAHSLKSASANIGALPFSVACKNVEFEARTAVTEDVRRLVLETGEMFSEVETALRQFRETCAS